MIAVLGVVIVAALVLVVPGLACGAAVGLRSWTLLGTAPALTLGAAGLLVTVTSAFGVPWTPLFVVLMLFALCLLLAALCRPWRRALAGPPTTWRPMHHFALGASVLLGGAWAATVVFRATRRLTAVSQEWDAIFHAGAIRRITAVHDASPSVLNVVGQPANPNFYYPDAYHALGALLYQLVPITPAEALNAFSVVTPPLFCLTIALLARTLTHRPAVTVAAVLLASTVTYFPFDVIRYGPLLPFALAIAVVPAVIALLERTITRPGIGPMLALALAASGLVATHPSVAVAAALWCLVHVVVRVAQLRRCALRGIRTVAVAAALTVVLMVPVIGALGSVTSVAGQVHPAPFASPGAAIGSLMSFNNNNPFPQWTLAAVFVIGVIAAGRSSLLWSSLAAAALFTALFMLSAAYDNTFALSVTSLWWDDVARFAALFAPPAVLISAVGLVAVRDGVLLGLHRISRARLHAPVVRPVTLLACVLAFWLLSGLGYEKMNLTQLRTTFTDGPTLSTGERQALAYLASVNDGGAVLNDPNDGTGWGYALDGLNMVFPTPVTPPAAADDYGFDRLQLLREFNQINTSTSVQQAAAHLQVEWVVLGQGFIKPYQRRAPGLDELDRVDSLTKVFDNGQATIYKLTRPSAG